MESFTLPIPSSEMSNVTPDTIINMSRLSFKCEPEKQIRAAFLFIRNTSLNAILDFSNCSPTMKADYVYEYLHGTIGVDIKSLVLTWIDILYCRAGYSIQPRGILNIKEIDYFIFCFADEVDEVLNLAISLPMASIQYYSSKADTPVDMSDVPVSTYGRIHIENMIRICENPDFMHLVNPVNGLRPKFYVKYFDPKNNHLYGKMINALPYLGLMNVMFNGSSEVQQQFLDGLKNMMKKEDE